MNLLFTEFMKTQATTECSTAFEKLEFSKNDDNMRVCYCLFCCLLVCLLQECRTCLLKVTESRMAVCQTCGLGSNVLEREEDGRVVISNKLKVSKLFNFIPNFNFSWKRC